MMSLTTRYKHLKVETTGPVALVTISRPDVLNALNHEAKMELSALLAALNKDAEVRAIIITGEGEKAFSAGADIGELKTLTPLGGLERAFQGQELSKQIEQLDKPVIAAINGYALGGGCELALACDIRVASDKAKLGQPEVNLGLTPGFGGTQRLPRLIGKGKAMELILTGDMIDAQEALRIGLVQKVVPHNELITAAKEIGAKIASKGPLAISFAKKAIHEGLQVDLDRGLKLEATYFSAICSTKDKTEGTAAFLEKRAPKFKGE